MGGRSLLRTPSDSPLCRQSRGRGIVGAKIPAGDELSSSRAAAVDASPREYQARRRPFDSRCHRGSRASRSAGGRPRQSANALAPQESRRSRHRRRGGSVRRGGWPGFGRTAPHQATRPLTQDGRLLAPQRLPHGVHHLLVRSGGDGTRIELLAAAASERDGLFLVVGGRQFRCLVDSLPQRMSQIGTFGDRQREEFVNQFLSGHNWRLARTGRSIKRERMPPTLWKADWNTVKRAVREWTTALVR
jgi:hypothetical protein